jgi:hypothetical protein
MYLWLPASMHRTKLLHLSEAAEASHRGVSPHLAWERETCLGARNLPGSEKKAGQGGGARRQRRCSEPRFIYPLLTAPTPFFDKMITATHAAAVHSGTLAGKGEVGFRRPFDKISLKE